MICAAVAAPLILVAAIPYGDWRKELALSSMFKDNLLYAATDYDRVKVDRINTLSLHVMQLNDFLHEGHDACVEAYVNLPNKMGGMNGFKWVAQYFQYDEQDANFINIFSLKIRKSWSHGEILYGRCLAPNTSEKNFFGFYSR